MNIDWLFFFFFFSMSELNSYLLILLCHQQSQNNLGNLVADQRNKETQMIMSNLSDLNYCHKHTKSP